MLNDIFGLFTKLSTLLSGTVLVGTANKWSCSLSFIGRGYPFNKFREQQEEAGQERHGQSGPARSWVFMYVETVLRAAGVPSLKIDTDLRTCRKFWVENWFKPQAIYHTNTAAKMNVLGKRLHTFSFVMFLGAMAMVLIKLVFGAW